MFALMSSSMYGSFEQKWCNWWNGNLVLQLTKFVELEDPFQNAGAQILKQASEETNNSAGDGTTTATGH